MVALRTQIVRISLTLCLIGLIVFCIVRVKTIEDSSSLAWQENIRKQEMYEKAPNCFPHRESITVDQSIVPCQTMIATLVGKTRQSYGNPLRYYRQPIFHLFFTLHFSNGGEQTIGTIYRDMWQSARVGDQVAVTSWDGQAENASVNGYSCPLIDMTGADHGVFQLLPWLVLAFLCAFLISRLWTSSANSMFLLL